MKCPKCSYERVKADDAHPQDECPSCGVYYAKVLKKNSINNITEKKEQEADQKEQESVFSFLKKIAKALDPDKKKKEIILLKEQLVTNGFNHTYQYPTSLVIIGKFVLMADVESKKLVIIETGFNRIISHHIVNAKSILSSQVIKNNSIITKASTGGTIGRAIIGGLISGGVGAIIGGVTSSKKNVELLEKLEIEIIVDDSSCPVHKISFVDIPVKENSLTAIAALKNVQFWQAIIELMMMGVEVPPGLNEEKLSGLVKMYHLKYKK